MAVVFKDAQLSPVFKFDGEKKTKWDFIILGGFDGFLGVAECFELKQLLFFIKKQNLYNMAEIYKEF